VMTGTTLGPSQRLEPLSCDGHFGSDLVAGSIANIGAGDLSFMVRSTTRQHRSVRAEETFGAAIDPIQRNMRRYFFLRPKHQALHFLR
jgi:hypothetical protein